MSAQENTINVEEIMKEIKEEASRLSHAAVPEFTDISDSPILQNTGLDSEQPIFHQIDNEVSYLKANMNNPYYYDVGSGLKGFLKRIIRKLNKPIIFPMSERQNAYNEHTANFADAAKILLYDQETRLKQQENEIHQQEDRLQQQKDRLQQQETRIQQLQSLIDQLSISVSRTIREYLDQAKGTEKETIQKEKTEQKHTEASKTDENKAEDHYSVLDYFQFQNDFRGTQAQIMERQKIYLPYFKGKKGRIFDLGCGRGEFLCLLRNEGISAFGADTYPEYAITGKLHEIEIFTADGIALLENQEEPLGGIFSAQVIEHLGFSTVERLCKLAFEKLEKGGTLILETPNPMCLSTMTNAFYLDPTHDKPIHPLLIEYLLKQIGFSKVKLLWPDHSLPQLPLIESDSIRNITEVNEAINRVSDMLFGSQDYAVIATK